MKKIKKIFASSLIFILPALIALTTTASVFGVVNATFIINDEDYFTVTDSGHEYKCYTIDSHTVEVDEVEYPTVAIAWALSETNAIPSTLTVPETVSHNDTTYYVSAVYKAGFRYCTFTGITLPNSILTIGNYKTIREYNESQQRGV